MKIDTKLISNIKDNSKYKNESMSDNNPLEKEFYTSLKNFEKDIVSKSSYEAALWIESNEKYLSSIGKHNIIKYKPGDIVSVDLGCNNYYSEFSYIHPAVIIKDSFNKVFIVPCTSQIYKDNNRFYHSKALIGKQCDGFIKNSMLLLNEAKFIDKNRIISKLGCVTHDFYNKLYNKLFTELFESKNYELEIIKEKLKKYDYLNKTVDIA